MKNIDDLIKVLMADPSLAMILGLIITAQNVTVFYQKMVCYVVMLVIYLIRNHQKVKYRNKDDELK